MEILNYSKVSREYLIYAYADGEHSIFEISCKIQKNLKLVLEEANIISQYGLLIWVGKGKFW